MKKIITSLLLLTVIICFFARTDVEPIYAQEATPIPTKVSVSTPDLESRVVKLEAEQANTIKSLEASNQANISLITAFSIFIGILVTIQGFVSINQIRREGKRDEVDRAGAEKVSLIMDVVERTLESRLNAEERARREAEEAQRQLQDVLARFSVFEKFYGTYQKTIKKIWQSLEDRASEYSQISRHGFGRIADSLYDFSQQYDDYASNFETLEEEPQPFSARVPYILGISSLLANQPQDAKEHLNGVVNRQSPEPDEDEISFKSRVVNAYYYLGVIESNFGNYEMAITLFSEAKPKRDDFLTKIVIAETYIMLNDLDQALNILKEVEERLNEIDQNIGRLEHHQLRLRSRSILLRANIVILGRETNENWHSVSQELLEQILKKDLHYYFATTTLAQIHFAQNNSELAKEHFIKAYNSILDSNDLLSVTETRSRILLLMVAAICSRHGNLDIYKSDEYLDNAKRLLESLPKIGSEVCTVYSPLSKRNESADIIRQHIGMIRAGKFLIG